MYALGKACFAMQNGQTALHVCCFKGHANLVQFLCSSGANTEIQDKVIVVVRLPPYN